MADLGEVNIEVKAEGADDAAQDAQEGAKGGGGVGGAGGEDRTLGTAIRGGIVGGLLSQALGPVLDILDPILKILQAFLAPVAVILMRLLTPVMRWLIKILPRWMQFINKVGAYMAVLAILPSILWRLIRDLGGWFKSLPGKIWEKMKGLAGDIWTAFRNEFPGLASKLETLFGGGREGAGGRYGGGNVAPNVPRGLGAQGNPDPYNFGNRQDESPTINISGGLDQFISRITRNGRFDF